MSRAPGLYVILDGPIGHESGRFLEVEDQDGRSVRVGCAEERWVGRESTWAVGPFGNPEPRSDRLGALCRIVHLACVEVDGNAALRHRPEDHERALAVALADADPRDIAALGGVPS